MKALAETQQKPFSTTQFWIPVIPFSPLYLAPQYHAFQQVHLAPVLLKKSGRVIIRAQIHTIWIGMKSAIFQKIEVI